MAKYRSRPELPFAAIAFVVYLVFQVHAVFWHGYWGQDILEHKSNISLAADNAWKYSTTYRYGRTNPPLYHVLGGFVKKMSGVSHYLLAVGLMNVLFGAIGVVALYALSCRMISSPVLRLSAFVFLLFLPFAMIQAEVIASDALTTPLFLLFVWVAVSLPGRTSPRGFWISAAAAALLMLAGVMTKFTFDCVIAGSALWLLMLWRTHLVSERRLIILFVLVTLIPGWIAYAVMKEYRSQQKDFLLGVEKRPSLSSVLTAEMNPRSILFVRPSDVDLLRAPSYDWYANGVLQLTESNKHSFPALLHLAIFTDILNVYQGDPYYRYFGSRDIRNHKRMQMAVRTGIIFSLLALIGVAVVFVRSFLSGFYWGKSSEAPVLTLLLFSMTWFVSFVVLLPFIPLAYNGGYWLPRLTSPALLGFFLTAFVFLDRLSMSRVLRNVVLFSVIAQSSLHASFLWPTRSSGPFYESNEDLFHIKPAGAVRIFDWQDRGVFMGNDGYWLGNVMGIILNRRDSEPTWETWRLSFMAAPGPANPGAQRRMRISCRNCKTRIVDFAAPTRVTLDVPAAAGRNDVLLEVLAPEQVVHLPGDPMIRLVHISQIEFTHSGTRAVLDYSPRSPLAMIVSVSPHFATERKQSFRVVISDEMGYQDVDDVFFLVSDVPVVSRYTCHGYYYRPSGALLLYRDTTTLEHLEGIAGKGTAISSGLCTLDPASTSAQGFGSELTVNFSLSLDGPYNNKKVYFWLKDHDQHDTGWIDTGTRWQIPNGK